MKSRSRGYCYIVLLGMLLTLVACGETQSNPAATEPLRVVITQPEQGQIMAPNLVLRATASSSERLESIAYSLNGEPLKSIDPRGRIEIPLQDLQDGIHQISLIIRDESGREATATRIFTVDSTSQPDVDFSVGFDPTALGFSVSSSGEITVVQHTVTFSNKIGALPVVVEGYTIEFKDRFGDQLLGDDSTIFGEGSLHVNLPVAPHEPVVLQNFVNLPSAVIDEVMLFAEVGMHANIYFNGTDIFGRPFKEGPFQVAVILPVGQ